MQIILGQQYNVRENPPLYCTLTSSTAMQGHQTKQQGQNGTSSNSKDEYNTTLKREQMRTMVMMWNLHIIQVHDTVHLELAEEQWEITQGSKRQAERTGFLAQYLSGLRHADAPHT